MEKTQKPKYSVSQCVGYMLSMARRHCPSVLWVGLGWAAASLGIQVLGLFLAPAVLADITARVPVPRLLGTIAGFSLGLLVLQMLRSYLEQNTLYGRIEVRVAVLGQINKKVCTTSYPNTKDPQLAKLHQSAREQCNGNSDPAEYIWKVLFDLLLNLGGFAVYLAVLIGLQPWLLALVTATSVLGFFVSRYISQWSYRHREEEAALQKKLWYLIDTAAEPRIGKELRIFGLGDWLQQVTAGVQRAYNAFHARRERAYAWASAVDAVLGLARGGIAYFWLIRQALAGQLSAPEFLLYFSAFSGFSAWVTGILQQYAELYKQCLGISTVLEYLHIPEPFRFAGGEAIPAAPYTLEMRDVTFRYPGTDAPIFSHLNFTLYPGEKVAVVGLNGAGKTTLVKLLCGLYDPDEGAVLLNGVDIRRFDRAEYYALFSAVFQKWTEMDISLAQAVAQHPTDIDMARVRECVEKAGLADMVAGLPAGYDTHIGKQVWLDGVQLSGGQTQRLMLARALYKGGAFLVLDEPTAALDPLAEQDIYQKYHAMTAGRSSVFISHRLASTRFCDRVLFIQNGTIAEEGTHESLLAAGGGYAGLFRVQARYYRENQQEGGENNEIE